MGTAPMKSCAAGQLGRPARDAPVPESMAFLISEEDGGAYRWRIVAGDGATLARSGSFAPYQDAEQAAQRVRDGAASAAFNRRGRELDAVDLATRRNRPRDQLNAERWVDEGASFTRETVARWPDRR